MARMTGTPTADQMAAYAKVKGIFNLKAAQRDLLDRSDFYTEIMDTAQHGMINGCGQYLMEAGIIGLVQMLDGVERHQVNPSGCIQGL